MRSVLIVHPGYVRAIRTRGSTTIPNLMLENEPARGDVVQLEGGGERVDARVENYSSTREGEAPPLFDLVLRT